MNEPTTRRRFTEQSSSQECQLGSLADISEVFEDLEPNVGDEERYISVAAGAGLVTLGLTAAQHGRLPLLLMGSALLFRGFVGWCGAYQLFGVNTACDACESKSHSGTKSARA